MDYQTFHLQTTMFNTISHSLKTGDVFLDGIMTIFAMSFVGWLINHFNLSKIIELLINNLKKICQLINNKLHPESKFNKKIVINEITENKEINGLYTAYYWYLSSTIDLVKETPLKYSTTKDCDLDEDDLLIDSTINKTLTHNVSKMFDFNGHQILYSMGSEVVTIYGVEKERKRENNCIYLETNYSLDKTVDVFEDLSHHVMNEYGKYKSGNKWEQKIYLHETNAWKPIRSDNKRQLKTLILKEHQKERLIDDIDLFVASEDWYNQRDIPYRRGYLLYGHPGTGKTSFFKALSNHLNRHIHYLRLNEISSDLQLFELLKSINYKKTILVIEDIDCISKITSNRNFSVSSKSNHKSEIEENNQLLKDVVNHLIEKDKKKNNDEEDNDSKLTLSGLLNALDGVFSAEGRILVMTSNYPEILDKALIRPGRIDMTEYFSKCDYYQIYQLYQSFYETTTIPESIKNIPENEYSAAKITGVFLKNRKNPEKALEELINGNDENNEFSDYVNSRKMPPSLPK
jgi:AAA+ superfamily predicted ATPase